MSGLNVKKDKNVLSANWEANLLIKDRLSGKLKRLRFQNYPDRLKELLEEEEKEKNKQSEKEEPLKLVAPAGDDLPLKIAPAADHFLAPPFRSGQALDAKAELHFHPEDKQQVENIAQSLPTDDSKKYSLEKIVDTLLIKQDLGFDEDNKEKFSKIIFDFFRNRKRFLTVRELLLESVRTRAGRLTEQSVDAVLSVVKSLKAKLEAAGGLVVRWADQPQIWTPSSLPPQPTVAQPLGQIPKEPAVKAVLFGQQSPEEIAEALQEIREEFPVSVKSAAPVATALTPSAKPSEIKPVAPPASGSHKSGWGIPPLLGKKIEAAPTVQFPVAVQPAATKIAVTKPAPASVPRPAVTDVVSKKEVVFKAVPQVRHVLTGPVAELEALTLENFRRLGADSREVVERLADKIKVLEHDSFTKKAQGIEAWRRSETHQLYLQIGLESMQSGQDVSQLINQKQKTGQKTLTMEEFIAISDLNKKLRF